MVLMTALHQPRPGDQSLLRRADLGRADLETGLQSGMIRRIRRDTYIRVDESDPSWQIQLDAWRAVLARVRHDGVAGVVALESAALMHGATPLGIPSRVDLVIGWNATGLHRRPTRREPSRTSTWVMSRRERRRVLSQRTLVRHKYPLEDADVVDMDGLRVTDLERTIEDCARFLEPDHGLAVVDSLLARACGAGSRPWDRRAELLIIAQRLRRRILKRLDARRGQRGVRRARAIITAATPLSQSPWESEIRRLCLVNGLRGLTAQLPIPTADGTKYIDLGWLTARLGLEVDGRIKSRADPDAETQHMDRRDAAVLSAGFGLVHVTPDELRNHPDDVVAHLRSLLPIDLTTAAPVIELRTYRERLDARARSF